MDLYAFEEVLKTGCENFVEAGLTLGQIREPLDRISKL